MDSKKSHKFFLPSSQYSIKELLQNDFYAGPYSVLLIFLKLSSSCLNLPHLGATAEVTVMLSQTASPRQLGDHGQGCGDPAERKCIKKSQPRK